MGNGCLAYITDDHSVDSVTCNMDDPYQKWKIEEEGAPFMVAGISQTPFKLQNIGSDQCLSVDNPHQYDGRIRVADCYGPDQDHQWIYFASKGSILAEGYMVNQHSGKCIDGTPE